MASNSTRGKGYSGLALTGVLSPPADHGARAIIGRPPVRWKFHLPSVTIAPYRVHLTLLDDISSEAGQAAVRFYNELWASGVEVLFDDRDERAGVKFADADIIGPP